MVASKERIAKAKAALAKPYHLNEYEEHLMQELFEQFERRCPQPHLVLLCEEQAWLDLRSKFF